MGAQIFRLLPKGYSPNVLPIWNIDMPHALPVQDDEDKPNPHARTVDWQGIAHLYFREISP